MWGATKSKDKMGKRIELIIGPGLIGMERSRKDQLNMSDGSNVRELNDLAITITMKACLVYLGGTPIRRMINTVINVIVVCKDIVQNELGRDTECEDQ